MVRRIATEPTATFAGVMSAGSLAKLRAVDGHVQCEEYPVPPLRSLGFFDHVEMQVATRKR